MALEPAENFFDSAFVERVCLNPAWSFEDDRIAVLEHDLLYNKTATAYLNRETILPVLVNLPSGLLNCSHESYDV